MNADSIITSIQDVMQSLKESVLNILPDIFGALLILMLGILLARLLRALIQRLLLNPNRFFSALLRRGEARKVWIDPSVVKIIGSFVYWMIVFLFLTASTEILGLPVVTTWLSGIANYLPRILTAVLVGVASLIGAKLIGNGVVRAAQSFGLSAAETLGKIARLLVLLLSVLIAVDLVGLDVSLLVNIIYIVIGALLSCAALAFGLGARGVVANILASYYIQKTYEVGQRIKIGSVEGRITRITPTALILMTAEEQILIPADKFSNSSSTLVLEEG